MTLRELIEWAERNGIDQDWPLLAYTQDYKNALTDIDTACVNGRCIQLNVRPRSVQSELEALEEEYGPTEARRIMMERFQEELG
jgi:hypothetical protein